MIPEHFTLEMVTEFAKNTMVDHLGIEFTAIGKDTLTGKMPVDYRTVQPYRLLHGGASVALAETLGSMASALCIDQEKYNSVGIAINANHIGGALEGEGWVIGTAKAIHIGRSTHVWEIKIEKENGKLVCISRLTVAVIKKK